MTHIASGLEDLFIVEILSIISNPCEGRISDLEIVLDPQIVLILTY